MKGSHEDVRAGLRMANDEEFVLRIRLLANLWFCLCSRVLILDRTESYAGTPRGADTFEERRPDREDEGPPEELLGLLELSQSSWSFTLPLERADMETWPFRQSNRTHKIFQFPANPR